MKTKHTKGDWTYKKIFDSTQYMILVEDTQIAKVETYWGGISQPVEANAKLIAAAPELLECVKIMKEWIDWKYSDEANKDMNLENIKQVIKKATE